MNIGDPIPPFTLPDDSGKLIDSQQLKGRNIVLFFYPRDNSPGCIIEHCTFRDSFGEFESEQTMIMGVSEDSVSRHRKFKKSYQLPFTLLSDKGNILREKFGVERGMLGLLAGRETFVFDKDSILQYHFQSDFRPLAHVRKSLEAVRKLNAQEK